MDYIGIATLIGNIRRDLGSLETFLEQLVVELEGETPTAEQRQQLQCIVADLTGGAIAEYVGDISAVVGN